ncbi:hypothetical protein [Hymenobacter negativus]|uniref:Uncharacterized protein n=1 Tax=Hymenobacter negativus TaxID=2795026 RepID=A0ABS0Q2U8_9BACT|nr:hypothetical protein [Hymenobacter negativus]MBH8556996.1 hypothetical protein [Hymenobacter negativus]
MPPRLKWLRNHRYPGRIRATYIREVQGPAIVGPISEKLKTQDVLMLLVADYATAAAHAVGLGLVG